MRQILRLHFYDTDVEPPLTSGQLNTTVNVSLTILCATTLGDYAEIEGWLRMVSNTPCHYIFAS